MDRRSFLATSAALPLALPSTTRLMPSRQWFSERAARIKLSLNAYSFNDPLTSGEMSLDDLLALCSDQGFDAVDLTGYYFPGYPAPPPDDYLYQIKRSAFVSGLDISGTGVRNDFTLADPAERAGSLALVKSWIEVAARMGAPVLRVFAGHAVPQGYARSDMLGWVVENLRASAEYGRRYGVMVVLQNHNGFVKTADDVVEIFEQVGSPWLGLNLDIGSFHSSDPYSEIARVAPYAVTWQIKENVNPNGRETPTDLSKIVEILHAVGYRGYIPLETLGPGDPKVKVTRFLADVRQALASY